jgi:hypothetical protein
MLMMAVSFQQITSMFVQKATFLLIDYYDEKMYI